VEAGAVAEATLDARVAALGGDPAAPIAARPSVTPDHIDAAAGAPHSRRQVAGPPRYHEGDAVRTLGTPRRGHTRLPAYARGKPGRIVAWHEGWVLPDSNAHGQGEHPQHLYTVAFSGADLWGPESEPGLTVCLDLFESYLEGV
jgi:nitrile hydratase